MEKNEYKCECCKQVYIRGWSDEEAKREFKKRFPEEELDETCSLVCDDCYKKLMENLQ